MHENKEHWILHNFKKKYNLYANNPPDPSNHFEWLAILQHHGCPTRLLDFTYSIYIAAYFAIHDATSESALWAINIPNLRKKLWERMQRFNELGRLLKDAMNVEHMKIANRFIANYHPSPKETINFVINIDPLIHSSRLSAQQGLFLMPTNLKESFMTNLFSAFGALDEEQRHFSPIRIDELALEIENQYKNFDINVMKIKMPDSLYSSGLEELQKMNITSESLFSGLDGLARSFIQTVIR
jgi:hypothetical protein